MRTLKLIPVRLNALTTRIIFSLLASLALAGCGGGGGGTSTSGGGGGGGTPDFSGLVLAPANQLSGLSKTRFADSSEPVVGATVQLIRLSNGSVVSSTATDSNGRYAFASVADNQEFEIRATKGALQLRGIVRSASGNNEVVRNLDAASTVVTKLLLDQVDSLRDADDTFTTCSLFEMAQDLEEKLGSSSANAPDLTDEGAIEAAAATIHAENSAEGSYVGTYSGGLSGTFAIHILNGAFVAVAFPVVDSIQSLNSSVGTTPNQVVMDLMLDTATLHSEGYDGLFLTGVVVGDSGSGTWSLGSKTGTWKVAKASGNSGLYAGAFDNDSPANGGYFFILIDPQGTAYLDAVSADGFDICLFGKGSLSGGTSLSYTWKNDQAQTGTSTGSRSGNVISGTYIDPYQIEHPWTVSREFDPAIFLF